MELLRSEVINSQKFEIGDNIEFFLNTGEKMRATAVLDTVEGMLFLSDDCLTTKYIMDEYHGKFIDYEHSDLNEWLNSIYISFKDDIKDKMVPFPITQTQYDNKVMVRIPTEYEIFGSNYYGEREDEYVRQFEGMDQRKNRIAFYGLNSDENAYWWTQTPNIKHAKYDPIETYCAVSTSGRRSSLDIRGRNGVRFVFCLSYPTSNN